MNSIWLVGSGLMAIEYAKVLKEINVPFITIGRGVKGVNAFRFASGEEAINGGLSAFLETNPKVPEFAIVAVSIENLADTCVRLLGYGIKNILLEKPGVGFADEIYALNEKVIEHGANVLLAYNRRFYASVIEAQKRIESDGGVTSFHFEFTEWSHQIRVLKKHNIELENWFLGNSSHVIDTAFFLCGSPKEICCYHKGGNEWHPKSTIHVGAGISQKGALFSYMSNWEAPGRWALEIMTAKRRYIFKPMEKLQVMNIGSVKVDFAENLDYTFDEKFKPGVYLQTKAFLNKDYGNFINLKEQSEIMSVYRKISGY